MSIHIKRIGLTLKPDQTRVLLRPFETAVLLRPFETGDSHRVQGIINRIVAIPEEEVTPLLEQIAIDFSLRHKDIWKSFRQRFEYVCGSAPETKDISEQRKLLIGSYLLAEYSLESAALFNPSIVPHPDQSGLPLGALRFILTLRATGEGHISSITFRTGMIHPDRSIEVFKPTGYVNEPQQVPNSAYEKALFGRKLAELGLKGDYVDQVLSTLPDPFTLHQLGTALKAQKLSVASGISLEDHKVARGIWNLARSNYEVQFQAEQDLSERVLFPATPSQRNGIEDARFVCFQKTDGAKTYFATFTAFDGKTVFPELLETSDFLFFKFITLNGPAAKNKGMAMFPRKIGGRYAMLGRQDSESISLMFSDNIHFWNEHAALLKPLFPWELIQIGNCGSPIETEAGWLVLSHGVGPMRKYSIGAFLLDLNDPSKVTGRLREPLLEPNQEEREGYVPNVVYTCGAIVHNGELIIPYGLADHATGIATVPLAEVLAAME